MSAVKLGERGEAMSDPPSTSSCTPFVVSLKSLKNHFYRIGSLQKQKPLYKETALGAETMTVQV